MKLKKNMKLGNKYNLFLVLIFLFSYEISFTDDKITSSPLINLEKIKPSFDELNDEVELSLPGQNIKKKKKFNNSSNFSHVVLIGLDKITAKSSHLIINLNEIKKLKLKISYIYFQVSYFFLISFFLIFIGL